MTAVILAYTELSKPKKLTPLYATEVGLIDEEERLSIEVYPITLGDIWMYV